MTAEIGHFALILALLVSLAQAAVSFIALRRHDLRLRFSPIRRRSVRSYSL